MGFFNTIGLRGKKLKQAEGKAKTQNEIILSFFKQNIGAKYTPSDIHIKLFDTNTPLTSVRRAMSDLTRNNKLEQTATKKEGNFGTLNYCWTYKI